MTTILNERTSAAFTLYFRDEGKKPITPTWVIYRVDDISSGSAIIEESIFIPTEAAQDIEIDSEDNRILNPGVKIEYRRITVSILYGAEGKRATAEFKYGIRNLNKIT